MKLALFTPVWIPTLHDLTLMSKADRIVLQDTEPFSRKGRMHRARVRTPKDSQWIHIPVMTSDRSAPVNEVRIDQEHDWVSEVLRVLKLNYRNSVYFDFYEEEIEADFAIGRDTTYLIDFIRYTHRRLFDYLYLDISEEAASTLNEYDSDPDILARNLGADQLYQEPGGRQYQRQSGNRIEPDIRLPEYRQHFGGFVEDCCLLDLLFEYGPESFKVIDRLSAD